MRLNDAQIEKERYRGEPTTDDEGRTQWPVCVVWDDEVPGFGIRIYPPVRGRTSRKDFIVTWRTTGLKSRTMAIGTYGVDCTLRQARRTAREALDLARRGQDPIEARQRALGIGTNEDLASRFLFEHTAAAKKKPVPGGESAAGPPGAGATEAADPDAAGAAAASGTPVGEVAVGSPAGQAVTAAPEASAQSPAAPSVTSAAAASEPAPRDPGPTVSAAPEPEPSEQRAGGDSPGRAASAAPPQAVVPEVAAPPAASPEVTVPPAVAPQPGAPRAAAPAPPAPLGGPAAAGVPPPAAAAAARSPVAPAPPLRRGPTKVRLVPVPEGLHREIERRARAASLTVAAYLQGLIDREPPPPPAPASAEPSVRADAGAPPRTGESAAAAEPVMPKDLFARIQSSQTVDVSTVASDAFGDEEPGRRGE